jgi:Phasin protein
MDQKVTRLPQPTIGTSRQRNAAQSHDLDKLIVAGQGAIDCWQAITAEMLAFWQSRLKDGLATGGRLLESTSVDSALEAQLDYAKAAMQAYSDQSARITRLMMRAVDPSFLAAPTTASSDARTKDLAA